MLFFGNFSIEKENILQQIEFKQQAETNMIEGKALKSNMITLSTETRVKYYFKDTPVLKKIAWCESKFKHLNKDGSILRGVITPKDIGVMQINEYYHRNTAEKLGYDIYLLDGNMAYAKWLYEKEGTAPWISSSKCWNKYYKDSKELAVK